MMFNIDVANTMALEAKYELKIELKTPVILPTLIILGGQPGSGKSNKEGVWS